MSEGAADIYQPRTPNTSFLEKELNLVRSLKERLAEATKSGTPWLGGGRPDRRRTGASGRPGRPLQLPRAIREAGPSR